MDIYQTDIDVYRPPDTVHPRALVRAQQREVRDIQQQMRKIIGQGEAIRKHLAKLKLVHNTALVYRL